MRGRAAPSDPDAPEDGLPGAVRAAGCAGAGTACAREVLLDRRTRERGLIDPSAVDALLDEHRNGRRARRRRDLGAAQPRALVPHVHRRRRHPDSSRAAGRAASHGTAYSTSRTPVAASTMRITEDERCQCLVSGMSAASRRRRLPPTGTKSSASTSNADKVAAINEGRSPIVEPGLDDLLQRRSRSRAGCARRPAPRTRSGPRDLSLVCVGTPSRKNGSLDLTYLDPRLRGDRPRAPRQGRLPRRRHPQHRAAGDDAWPRHSGARGGRRARNTARASASR